MWGNMTKKNNRSKGSRYEEKAAAFLKDQGYEILTMNYRTRFGEIDLIGRDENYLVFIEVKYRFDHRMGFPEEAVDRKKQTRIYRCAQAYLMEHGFSQMMPCRFDVVAISENQIRLWKNAFGGL